MSDSASWSAYALMGAYHGLNPAMGWLFAVFLGLQQQRVGAVLRALPPLALGHAASIALVVVAVSGAQAFLTPASVRYGSAALMLGFATYLILRRSHVRWVGMRLGFQDLTVWSFLMSSAHGAGLMLVPVLLNGTSATVGGHTMHGGGVVASNLAGVAAVAVHTLSMYLVMGTLALLMFRTMRLGVLRRAWVNLDVLWVGALVLAAVATLTLS